MLTLAAALSLGGALASADMASADPGHGRGRGGEHGGERGGGPPPWSHGRGGERGGEGWRGGESRGWGGYVPAPAPYGYRPPEVYVPAPYRGYAAPYAAPRYVTPRREAPRAYGSSRGRYLPPEYQGAVIYDYRRYRLRPPPPGYAWYRVGNQFLLASLMDGLIFDVIGR